jgi:hypothetical protein
VIYRAVGIQHPHQIRRGNHLAVVTLLGIIHHFVVTKICKTRTRLRIFVTHFYGPDLNPAHATVLQSELANFEDLIHDGLLVRMDYDHFSSRRIVVRAMYLRHMDLEYNLFEMNCEHVATWQRTGYARSPQAEHYMASSVSKALPLHGGT